MQNKEIRERNERIKQWLWRYREAKKDVRRLEEELQELIESQESSGAIEYSDMPKGGGNQSDLSDYMIIREEIQKKINEALNKKYIVLKEIEEAINGLKIADARFILSGRYLKEKSWKRICAECNYEWAQMHRIHSSALLEIYNLIKDDTK